LKYVTDWLGFCDYIFLDLIFGIMIGGLVTLICMMIDYCDSIIG